MAKDNYVIFNPEGGLGKIIASTAIIKRIVEKYPNHKIIVLTPWPEVYLNNPKVYRVYKSGNTPYFYRDYLEGRDSIVLRGEPYFNTNHLYSKNHLIQSWCELHNLPFKGKTKPELYFTTAEKTYYATNLAGDKPLLVMQTTGGGYNDEKQYSWTRDLPQQQAQILADNLSQKFKIIHISKKNGYQLNNVHRVDEVQNKRTFISILLKSEKRLLIDSCLQHAAAAFNLPSTVCWVGTSPNVFGYDIHTNILPNKDEKKSGGGYMIDSLFFDYDFNSPEYEYPYDDFDIFNLQTVYDSIVK